MKAGRGIQRSTSQTLIAAVIRYHSPDGKLLSGIETATSVLHSHGIKVWIERGRVGMTREEEAASPNGT